MKSVNTVYSFLLCSIMIFIMMSFISYAQLKIDRADDNAHVAHISNAIPDLNLGEPTSISFVNDDNQLCILYADQRTIYIYNLKDRKVTYEYHYTYRGGRSLVSVLKSDKIIISGLTRTASIQNIEQTESGCLEIDRMNRECTNIFWRYGISRPVLCNTKNIIAYATIDHKIEIFDFNLDMAIARSPRINELTVLGISPNNEEVIFRYGTDYYGLYNYKSNRLIYFPKILLKHRDLLSYVSFNASGDLVAIYTRRGFFIVFNIKTNQMILSSDCSSIHWNEQYFGILDMNLFNDSILIVDGHCNVLSFSLNSGQLLKKSELFYDEKVFFVKKISIAKSGKTACGVLFDGDFSYRIVSWSIE